MSPKGKRNRWVNLGISLTWFIFGTALLLGVMMSGLLIVQQSNERLQTYKKIEESRAAQTDALDEYSRLLIERGHFMSYQAVTERVTTSSRMEFAPEFEVWEHRLNR